VNIGIVTDSTCDLPDNVIDALSIGVVPLYINFGEESYLDGVDLKRPDFYRRLPDADPPPTTAIPGTEAFLAIYERIAASGATRIVSIHVSSALSGVLDAARVAARQVSIPVTVFDSGSLTLGLGFLVWEAARLAAEGLGLDDVLSGLRSLRRRTHVCAALDTLEFLRRSGRMNSVVAALGGLIRLKPLLKMNDGTSASEKVRTSEGAMRRLVELLQARAPVERVAIVHTHALERARMLQQRAGRLLDGLEVLSVDITPVLGTHLGPGAVGFACVQAKR